MDTNVQVTTVHPLGCVLEKNTKLKELVHCFYRKQKQEKFFSVEEVTSSLMFASCKLILVNVPGKVLSELDILAMPRKNTQAH